ncbi:hypothetical protein IJJ18_00060, partial [Candidatus Saccharibacteria bacterium]|nr:hypothetical protein [Candidatus Saccharibacteria bacterium]
ATTLTYTATMFDGDNPYVSKITIPTVSNLTANAESLDIPFGHSASVTVTPATGYYLSSVTCPTGFTCSGYEIDINNTSAQTITIVNNNTHNTGTLALSATQADPFAACGSTTGSQCTVAGVQYVRLADGHLWTKSPVNSSVTWYNLSTVSCPSGTSKPTASVFNTLLSNYGGSYNTSYGSPYGMYAGSGALYNATGWSGFFWSTTGYSSSAWYLYVRSSYAYVRDNGKTGSYQVVCYR